MASSVAVIADVRVLDVVVVREDLLAAETESVVAGADRDHVDHGDGSQPVVRESVFGVVAVFEVCAPSRVVKQSPNGSPLVVENP